MLKIERQNAILQEVRAFQQVKSSALSNMFEVSEDTIRRDLYELEEYGHLKRVHGGAVVPSYIPSFKKREVQEIETKHLIAKKALPLIEEGQVLIIDGGTSNLQLVNLLPTDISLTVFTNSIPAASKLCEFANIDSVLMGGNILRKGYTTVGHQALDSLADIHADICFVGITSIDDQIGLTEANQPEAIVKRAIINASDKVVTLAISSKIGTKQAFKVGPIDCLDVLITELSPTHSLLEPYQQQGYTVL
ncbi:DeoR/GlpR family DNA-binding transcription regulator [Tunicatimonas pelagia]|uniref:DeoR/GlpR family DNA-binding transcription regulator n=1 Tax=Tunicatimonas pelagia TaxID=931531 RepID=UPI002665FC7B|nr:DeoR/GlpR family DNA-binding transcription regulator [Tunicatimonas pelagia]WKN45092.1 DeoR/GlpR family DNA-binding transcription regulator [Tunicatimonas pelagia]